MGPAASFTVRAPTSQASQDKWGSFHLQKGSGVVGGFVWTCLDKVKENLRNTSNVFDYGLVSTCGIANVH